MVPLSRQGAATLCVTRSSAPLQPVHVCHSCSCPVRVSQEWETDQTAVRSWEELTLKQREAATFLGYTAHEWDEEMRGSEPPPDNGRVQKFADGEDVLAYDSSGKCLPAKILQSRRSSDAADGGGREYKVHYRGWKSKWDCWIGTHCSRYLRQEMQLCGLRLLCLQMRRSLRKLMQLVLCYNPITLRSGEKNERGGTLTSGSMLFWDQTVNGSTAFHDAVGFGIIILNAAVACYANMST